MIVVRCNGRDNTKKLWNFETLWSLKKTVVGYFDLKQQKRYEKLRNTGWYSKWYWYFNNATTTNDNNNDDNTPASAVTATANH